MGYTIKYAIYCDSETFEQSENELWHDDEVNIGEVDLTSQFFLNDSGLSEAVWAELGFKWDVEKRGEDFFVWAIVEGERREMKVPHPDKDTTISSLKEGDGAYCAALDLFDIVVEIEECELDEE